MDKNTKILIGAAAVGTAAYIIYKEMNKDKSLVLHYDFTKQLVNGKVKDLSMNDNDGTPNGTMSAPSSNGMTFDGVNDYISIPHSPKFNFGTGNFTIGLKFKGQEMNQWRWLITKGEYGNNGIVLATSGDRIRASLGSWFSDVTNNPSININNTTWYNYVLVRNNSIVKVYINGVQDGTSVTNSQSVTNDSRFFIGHLSDTDAGSYFKGNIDKVKIYKRALSENEIKNF